MSEETPIQILKQVEYYFSDSNFPRDRFLRAEAAKNVDNYIPIDVIASFNRMKTISTDLQLITDALKKSTRLQVSEDGKMVRRLDPLPENIDCGKTLYSKGWPEDTTIEKVQEFFMNNGGYKTVSVRLRKKTDKTFKGSLLADFETEEMVNKIISEAPKLDEKELIYQTFKQFSEEKKEEKEKYLASSNGDKKRKAKKDAERDDDDNNNDDVKEEKEEMVPGVILCFKGVGKGLHRGDIKEIFSQYGEVQFVGYNGDDENGSVRFKTTESCKRALESLTETKKEIGGQIPTYSVLDGEEEKKEWEKIFERKKAASANGGFKKGGFKKGGFKKGGFKKGNFKKSKRE
ncbi:hypothetical protein RB653_006091 [Dictyostelium firmibasis]|uniref:Uncharacterized protein n=1 Tax=Dictyostelium firmibasis TaxID=79012 RepID=A0AAN7YTH7_9MYCE